MRKIKRNDLIILNVAPQEAALVEKIRNFKELAEYKKKHQEVFVLAPHPLVSRFFSMGKKKLIKNMGLFDGVEHCWCYSGRLFNPNKKTKEIVERFNKPFVATSDAHFLKYFNTDYIVVEADELEPASVFAAIKHGAFTNVTKPKKIYQIVWSIVGLQFKKYFFFVFKKYKHKKKYN
jgi:predicted metal-dependent phosphoesterase TrpH